MRTIDLVAPVVPAMTAQRLQCFKTKRCRFWMENRCSRGDKCTYAHTDVELRCPPDLTKTKICTRWKRGACDKPPSECAYAHGVEDLRGGGEEATPSACASPLATTSSSSSAEPSSAANKSVGFSATKDPMTPSTSSGTLLSSCESLPTAKSASYDFRHGPSSSATTVAASSTSCCSAVSSSSSTSSSSGIRTLIGSKVCAMRLTDQSHAASSRLQELGARPTNAALKSDSTPRVPRLPLAEQNTQRGAAAQQHASPSGNEYSLDFTTTKLSDETKDTVRSVESLASTTFPPLTPAGTQRSFSSTCDAMSCAGFDLPKHAMTPRPLYDASDLEAGGDSDEEQRPHFPPAACGDSPTMYSTEHYTPAQYACVFPVQPYWTSSLYSEGTSVVSLETLCLISALSTPYYD
eukprot:Gregarina_sp_Pseudo_9__5847@NODE_901_length_2074_cov_752_985258_g846_i0_p1_GENE_NODE_901_length_2074_cov_752_985258_g846_i0NODE_901_length_2074_cov_752_985258_g846_i0_p1_ORF_typecomplete_len407_score65_32zfCCCH/PF00642_24/1_9e08zfCCCH/PF00642_24/0_035zfCCCH_3/PF15663_5/1_5e09zf_CCCH_4/PF18345_1/1e07zf_CCCH_4/PF18345_1/2_3e03zf_CCCH_4/PF18345_1/3_2e03zfCCCH_4/PF18044_1/1_6e05zfCCCH_4/PF18044_1/2_2e03zfCCCH_4/PF18044_1/5_9e03Torus/PF16131_5/0_062Torus/PF16131_5/0_27Torus/PF16131_5/6_3e03zfCCCH_2/P